MNKKTLLFLLFFPFLLFSQNKVSLEFDQIRFDELKVGGFAIHEDRSVLIEAVGAGFPGGQKKSDPQKYRYDMSFDQNRMFVYAWIINAETRELVWRMSMENTDRKSWARDYLRDFSQSVSLPAGRYEVYLWAMKPNKIFFREDGLPSLGRFFQQLIKGERWLQEVEESCHIRVGGVDELYSTTEVRQFQRQLASRSVVSLLAGSDHESLQEFFSLSKPGEFEIYSVGEAFDDEEYDYGWIEKIDDNKKIWEAREEFGEPAGGAQKNRIWKTTLKLAPGDYSINFVTDDSHSPEVWNSNPPYDPFFWGITLSGILGKFNPADIRKFEKPAAVSFLRMTRVGSNRLVQQGIRLDKPAKIRIYALGEGFPEGMSDYAWIVNEKSGERVWEMRYEQTRHAGGAQKNRLADQIIKLDPGVYRVYYQTDDSHAYRDWNSKPPRNPADWGVTLYLADKQVSPEDISMVDEVSLKPLIALTRLGDNELVRKSVQVRIKTRVKIRALGEGRDGEMFDYGWIEEAGSGQTIWKMEYDRTVPGGGSRKNRMEEAVISLTRGTYNVFFRTDDSHSYAGWNSRPPYNPEEWGITLYALDSDDGAVQPLDTPEPAALPPFIDLTGLGDEEFRSAAFKLKRDANLRIFALGEGRDGEMFDYGWIINTTTGRKVWQMEFYKTRPAGGAKKNRLIDEVVHLPAGTYTVYFRTDDSHSYPDWNARPPRQKEFWGIRVALADENFPKDQIEVFDNIARNEDILCRIARMGDSEHIIKRFTLDKATAVRIYAIGEGLPGEMVDYGWIENAESGEVLWIMDYEATRPAGGAYKNRTETGVLNLPAGEYRVHFVTDDSHSPRRWNATPPEDRENYGITIFRMKSK